MADTSTADLGGSHEPVTSVTSPPEPPSTTADVSAPSSGAEKSENKETLLEAVLKAVKPADDADEEGDLAGTSPPSEAAPTGPEAKPGEEDKTDLTRDPSPEELAAYNKRTRDRIEKLLGERNAFRVEAEVTQTLRNFLVTNDIAREDFQLTLDLAAAMRRGDFKAFLEGVGPYVQLATQAMGITLPPDLEKQVRDKQLTFDAAAQVSRDRYARALAEQRATRATQVMGNQQTARADTTSPAFHREHGGKLGERDTRYRPGLWAQGRDCSSTPLGGGARTRRSDFSRSRGGYRQGSLRAGEPDIPAIRASTPSDQSSSEQRQQPRRIRRAFGAEVDDGSG